MTEPGTQDPLRCFNSGRYGDTTMEDLESCLAGLGFRRARSETECWRVTQIDASDPAPRRRSASRRRDPARSRVLRFWLDRLSELDRPAPFYRISRVK